VTGARDTPEHESADLDGRADAALPCAAGKALAAGGAGGAAAAASPAPIVAIGASAGGLEAIEQFFRAVEAPSRFAFVIVQHLSPDFKNLMVDLLAKRTALEVRAVDDGMRPAANAIHLIPPGKTMTIEAGLLRLAERDPRAFPHHPIDEFFVSLATDRGPEAVGVVLSGSGSDGSRGARAISASGGRVLVQRPATARFSSMPQAAVDAGCTREVMAPEAIAAALLEPGPKRQAGPDTVPPATFSPLIVDCLASAFGIDVAAYRTDALHRRVQRRMMLRGFDEADAYAAFIADDADEQEALYQDLLIGVTGFFPGQAPFDALERAVVPALAARLDAGQEVRVWVPGCATGEEAYAIAILVLAHCRQPPGTLPLEILATDIHRRSLAVAGTGFYTEEAVGDLRAEWRQQFFTRLGSGYQVIPAVRDKVAFSPHDLLHDPPFTGLQLVSCRNVLNCLQDEAQHRVQDSLAHGLLPGGHLLLGPNETAGHADHFAAVDAAAGLYSRRRTAAVDPGQAATAAAPQGRHPRLTVDAGGRGKSERRDPRLTMAQEVLLDRYVPPSLLVDEAGQVVHCFGDAGAWLKAPRGRASLAVLDMVEDAIRAPLAGAITRARRTGQPVTLSHLPLAARTDGRALQRLVVEAPLVRADGQRCLLVSFDDRTTTTVEHGDAASTRTAALEAALQALLDAATDAVAVAAAETSAAAGAGDALYITATNPTFDAAAAKAGLATPLDGQPLSAILAALLAEPSPAIDQPVTLVTRNGDRLTLQPLPGAPHLIVILRLARQAALPTAEPAA
jgi:two-component system, chemotaxis family, CheB/CheR fusion protein